MQEYRDGLLGLAIGDAMGLPLVDLDRDELLKSPIVDMVSFDPNIKEGTWSIPTSLAIAIKESFDKHNKLNRNSIMKRLVAIYNGDYSLLRHSFSFGRTTKMSIERYIDEPDLEKCGEISIGQNGSGALLMMYPIAYYSYINKLQEKEVLNLVTYVVKLTHNHELNILGCYIYTLYLLFLLRGKDKYASLSMVQCCDFSMFHSEYLDLYSSILKDSLKNISLNDIKTDGYIVSTLEASLYVLLNSDNFSQSIIGAINLGNRSDIIGSIVGCMAGILYKSENIPEEWINKLRGKDILNKYM